MTPECEYQSAKTIAERKTGIKFEKPSALSRFWMKEGLKEIMADPNAWIKLLGKKLVFLVNDLEPLDTHSIEYFKDRIWLLRFVPLGYGVLLALGILGFILSLKSKRTAILPLFFFLAYAISLLAFFVSSRYRYPLVPPLILLAALGTQQCWAYMKEKKFKPLIGAGALFMTIFYLSKASPIFIKEARADALATPYANAAILHKDQGRLDEALVNLKKAIEITPHSARKTALLGELYYRQGKYEEALPLFHQAVSRNPSLDQAWNYAGIIFLKKGDYAQAAQLFRQAAAVSTVPEDIEIYETNAAEADRFELQIRRK